MWDSTFSWSTLMLLKRSNILFKTMKSLWKSTTALSHTWWTLSKISFLFSNKLTSTLITEMEIEWMATTLAAIATEEATLIAHPLYFTTWPKKCLKKISITLHFFTKWWTKRKPWMKWIHLKTIETFQIWIRDLFTIDSIKVTITMPGFLIRLKIMQASIRLLNQKLNFSQFQFLQLTLKKFLLSKLLLTWKLIKTM